MTETIDLLQHTDQDLFLWLNGIHSPWMDVVMYWVTYKFTWIPLYTILVWMTIKSEGKRSILTIVTVIVAVVVADKITSGLMKPYYMRFRPCHEPALSGLVHEVGGCGGLYGFASSHASTSFALATAWFLSLKHKFRYMELLLIWAALYSYSRVYVGVHYPGDIVTGAVIGSLTGILFIRLRDTFIKKYYFN
jgi:undecaprenyl-diphosphatase